MRSRFTMTSSYESDSRAEADEPDVGIPHILKRILRISLLARTVNREPALFWVNHVLTRSYSELEGPLAHSGLLGPGLSAHQKNPC
jgi:hypothetical protein